MTGTEIGTRATSTTRRPEKAATIVLLAGVLAGGCWGDTDPVQPEGPRPPGPTLPPPGNTAIVGTVVAVGGPEPTEDMWVQARSLSFRDSARLDSDGGFSLVVSATNRGYDGLVTVRVGGDQEVSATGVGFSVETGVIGFATVGIAGPGAFGRPVTRHELVHTLGPFHTCAWTSLMLGACGSGSVDLTRPDVAHIQSYLEHAAAREMASGTILGFRAALLGSRFERDSLGA